MYFTTLKVISHSEKLSICIKLIFSGAFDSKVEARDFCGFYLGVCTFIQQSISAVASGISLSSFPIAISGGKFEKHYISDVALSMFHVQTWQYYVFMPRLWTHANMYMSSEIEYLTLKLARPDTARHWDSPAWQQHTQGISSGAKRKGLPSPSNTKM